MRTNFPHIQSTFQIWIQPEPASSPQQQLSPNKVQKYEKSRCEVKINANSPRTSPVWAGLFFREGGSLPQGGGEGEKPRTSLIY